jgi:hypothetical protein
MLFFFTTDEHEKTQIKKEISVSISVHLPAPLAL